MVSVLVRHRVADYTKWKSVFDEDGLRRKQAGCRGGRVFRNADDPNDVVVLLEWEDERKARQFADSPGSQQAKQHAGVEGAPEVSYLNEADRPAQ